MERSNATVMIVLQFKPRSEYLHNLVHFDDGLSLVLVSQRLLNQFLYWLPERFGD